MLVRPRQFPCRTRISFPYNEETENRGFMNEFIVNAALSTMCTGYCFFFFWTDEKRGLIKDEEPRVKNSPPAVI